MLDRETLEAQALLEVCACQYYDLADSLKETADDDLQAIVNHAVKCKVCDA